VPLARWFRGPLRQRVRDSLLKGQIAESGWFNQKVITQIVDQHESGMADHSTPIWTLLMYDAFLRNVMNETSQA